MKTLDPKQLLWWNSAAVLLGLLPMVLYWLLFLRVPSVEPAEAKAILSSSNAATMLLDVRPASAYASNHLGGAANWPFASLQRAKSADDIPAALRDKKLLVICDSGLSSALAVCRLRELGVGDAKNVSGGMQAWALDGDGRRAELPFRPMSRFNQWLAVIVAFGVKPVYMLLSLALIVVLWRQSAIDLASLRWGLIWFWIGENGCSIDYLFYERGSDFWEFVHNYGMVVGFAFVVYAFLEGFDQRIVKFSPEKERCAALSLCRACIKYSDAPCGLKRLFTIMIPALAVLSLMPFSAELRVEAYQTEILGTMHSYFHPVSAQLLELRYCPALALVLFVVSWLVLAFKQRAPVTASKPLFAGAVGALSFGMLRMFFTLTFRDDLMWFDVWEEVTELLFILGAAAVLWVFRGSLFLGKPLASTQGASAVEATA